MDRSEKIIDFDEANFYVRYVQFIAGKGDDYYLPWRILYDNFMIFVVEGTVLLQFESWDIPIHKNELCIIPPFIKNRLAIQSGTYFEYYGVHFDYFYDDSNEFNEDVYIPEHLGYIKENMIEMPVDEKLINRSIYTLKNIQFPEKIKISNPAELKNLNMKLLDTFQNKSFGHTLLLKSIFYEIIYFVLMNIKKELKEGIEEQTEICRYMQGFTNDYNHEIDIVQIAANYGMSPKKFRAVFKNITQKTPKEYIIQNKMIKAKELLQTGKYNVSDVAYMVGYDDVFYFSKLFKRKMGKSPKTYINSDQT